MRNRILLLLALSALLAVAYVALNRASSDPAPAASRSLGEQLMSAKQAVPSDPVAPDTARPEAPGQADDKIARYEELRGRLDKARETRLASAATEFPTTGESEAEAPDVPPVPLRPPGSLGKEYIQEQIQEVVPLIRECYELALDTKPELQGRVVVEIKLIGEEDIGGLIESSLVVEDESDVTDPNFLECVRETMYAVELDAPEEGGEVVIKYPLNFASAPPGDKGDTGDDN